MYKLVIKILQKMKYSKSSLHHQKKVKLKIFTRISYRKLKTIDFTSSVSSKLDTYFTLFYNFLSIICLRYYKYRTQTKNRLSILHFFFL